VLSRFTKVESSEGSDFQSSVGRCHTSVVEDSASLGVGPITAQDLVQIGSCGSQSVSFASVITKSVPVITKFVPVVSIPSPDLVSILKRVPSNSEISRSNIVSPVEVVSDSSGCSLEVDSKGGRDTRPSRNNSNSNNYGVVLNIYKFNNSFLLVRLSLLCIRRL